MKLTLGRKYSEFRKDQLRVASVLVILLRHARPQQNFRLPDADVFPEVRLVVHRHVLVGRTIGILWDGERSENSIVIKRQKVGLGF